MTLSGQVVSSGDIVEVILAFSCANEQPPIKASEIEILLRSKDQSLLELVERPEGVLPEFGGGLGKVINARYKFSKNKAPVSHLIVRYQAEEVVFRLVESNDKH